MDCLYLNKAGKSIPEQALRVPGSWDSQISIQSAHESGKFMSPKHWPLLPSRNYSLYTFLSEAESTPGW